MDVLRRLDRGPGGMVEDNLSPDAPSSSASDSMVRRRSPGRAGRRPHPESQGRQPLEGFYLEPRPSSLLNQLDGTGPPPLAKDKIEQIPTVKIVQEQVDKLLQCTVCMEEFKTGEQVKRLPCQHHFHPDCIVPWLELHGTCPICRKLLNEEAGSESASAAGSSTSSGTSRAAGAGPLPRSQSDRHDAAMAALLRMHGAPRSARSSHLPPPAASASSSSSSTSSQPPTSRARRQSPANSTTSRRGSHPGGNQYSVYDFNDECD
ncbi:hypothetical protein HPB49_018518 [Dermacentor silvarum]|uniref:Uncharacterized protein n=1 Tax=Dermacentor silvarum TaxID=543639 RepID=A0ACB8D7N8_DERSI|nr:hypothetical protein HPB49_018518 [Dermacentor silvarum]